MSFLHGEFAIPYRTSFFGLQFLLMFLSGPAFALYLSRLGFTSRQNMAGMLIYYFSLPVFLAHIEPHHLWDDFWVFLMVPLALALTIERKTVLAVLTMTWAILAREITALFLPVWLLFMLHSERDRRYSTIVMAFVVTLLLVFTARLFLTGINTGDIAFKLPFNFENEMRTRDTIFSVITSMGFLWVTGLWVTVTGSTKPRPWLNIIRFGALFTVLGYISTTLLIAQARESRLLFPPFVFLIPLTLIYIEDRWWLFKEFYAGKSRRQASILTFVIIALSLAVATMLFPTFEYRSWHDGNRAYLGFHIAITLVLIFMEVKRRKLRSVNAKQTDDIIAHRL